MSARYQALLRLSIAAGSAFRRTMLIAGLIVGAAIGAIPGSVLGAETLVTFDAEAGQFPEGVAVDDEGMVYASLSPLGQLVRVTDDEAGFEVVGQIEGLGEGDFGLLGLTVGPDGDVIGTVVSANPEANGAWRFDVETGDVERIAGTEGVMLANAAVFDSEGAMYITDTAQGAIWRVAPEGEAEIWMQDALLAGDGSVGFPSPIGANGIGIDHGTNTLYVSVSERRAVVAVPIEADGSAGTAADFAVFTSDDEHQFLDGLAVDDQGRIYVTFVGSNEVVRVSQDGAHETIATAADGLDGPASVAVGAATDSATPLYVANFSVALAPIVEPGGAGPGIVMVEATG
jgi:streptogramin lyase